MITNQYRSIIEKSQSFEAQICTSHESKDLPQMCKGICGPSLPFSVLSHQSEVAKVVSQMYSTLLISNYKHLLIHFAINSHLSLNGRGWTTKSSCEKWERSEAPSTSENVPLWQIFSICIRLSRCARSSGHS